MSACSDVPFMLALSWRPGTRHCICQPDRTRAAPSLKEPFICEDRGRGRGENRRGGRQNSQWIKTSTLLLGGSQSNHTSEQSSITTGIRDGWLPLEAILQLDQATGRWGGGVWVRGCDGICSNCSKYHVCRGSSWTLCAHPDCSCRHDAATARRPPTPPNHQTSAHLN